MKKKLSAYELRLLLKVYLKEDLQLVMELSSDKYPFKELEERDLVCNALDSKEITITEKGKSFVKSLLKVKMPKQVWR